MKRQSLDARQRRQRPPPRSFATWSWSNRCRNRGTCGPPAPRGVGCHAKGGASWRILLNTLLLSFLVGCGHGSAPPPSEPASQAGMKKPATPEPASKPQSDQSPTAQPVPSGWSRSSTNRRNTPCSEILPRGKSTRRRRLRLKNRKAGQYCPLVGGVGQLNGQCQRKGGRGPTLAPGCRSRGLGNVERQMLPGGLYLIQNPRRASASNPASPGIRTLRRLAICQSRRRSGRASPACQTDRERCGTSSPGANRSPPG